MKKKICGLLLTGLALTACGDLSGYMRADRNAPFKTRLRACMLSEANDKLQNGTLLDKTLKETADEIADDCLRKLALQLVVLVVVVVLLSESILDRLVNAGK